MVDPTTHVRRLFLAFGIRLVLLLAELVAGLISNSLALLADAGHVLTDAKERAELAGDSTPWTGNPRRGHGQGGSCTRRVRSRNPGSLAEGQTKDRSDDSPTEQAGQGNEPDPASGLRLFDAALLVLLRHDLGEEMKVSGLFLGHLDSFRTPSLVRAAAAAVWNC